MNLRRICLFALVPSCLLATLILGPASQSQAADAPSRAILRRRAMPARTQAVAATSVATASVQSGIDKANFDTKVRPQDDLFRAVNGTWLARTAIPADRSDYGIFAVLAEKAEKDLREIIDAAAAAKESKPGGEQQQVGDLYASYLDEAKAEQLGIQPLAEKMAAVDTVANKAQFLKLLTQFEHIGISGPIACYVGTDAKNSDRHILHLSQAGLGLPDREYYWDAKYKAKLAAYGEHVGRMLVLAKVVDAAPAKDVAKQIVDLEARIAKAHWSKEQNRDANKTYNKMTLAELAKLSPGIDWPAYFAGLGVEQQGEVPLNVVVGQPSYLTALSEMFDSVPLSTWKLWLKWSVVQNYAGVLNKEMVDAQFAFYGTTLRGVPENRPRWKRAVGTVEACLGEALGKLYVEKHFPPEAKRRMDIMVKNVLLAYRNAMEKNDWMSAETRQKALAKLDKFTPKIGYPKKWRDYSKLEIRRGDLVGNLERAAEFEWNRNIAKLGKPVDRDEWHMTPQMINAYYNPSQNEIVFPAAILQPPFFDLTADDAVNYGSIGAVIGHEAGHGFDDQGSKWDGDGNLNQWWTPADRVEFDKRGDKLAAQYSRFEPFPGFKVNGRFTLGENIGDLSGLTISYAAYHLALGGKQAPAIDGMTGDQRFFLGWSQIWRRKHRDEDLKNRLLVDPHSPAEYRVNGTVRNVPAFYSAFGIKPSDKMYLPPDERVRIW